jgi:hypothetical protein
MSTAPALRPQGRRLAIPTVALTFALLAGGADLSAQRSSGHAVVLGGEIHPGTSSVITRSGPSGAEIKVLARGLPASTQVQIMMGALRDGFEIVQTVATDTDGRINGRDTVSLTVPDWVKNDRAYLVMITDLQYNPLASADMFHPTAADGVVTRRGTIKVEDPRCPTLTAEGAEIYFLVGDLSLLKAGQEMVVKGKVTDDQRCGNTTTIEVTQAQPVPK